VSKPTLFKTTAIIFSTVNPADLELSTLVTEAESGTDVYVTSQTTAVVGASDPDWTDATAEFLGITGRHGVLDTLPTPEQVTALTDDQGDLTVVIAVSLDTLVDADVEALNDTVSEMITGSAAGLTDIAFQPVGVAADGSVLVQVTARVTSRD